MVLQAGLVALLSRLGAGDDIAVGSPIAGRTDAALDDLIGFFVNTLVLRTDSSGNPSFRELVARVRAGNLAAYAHQDMPFERLVEVLNPARSMSRHPLFQVMLVFAPDQGDAALDLPGIDVAPQPVANASAKFDLSLSLAERRGAGGMPAGIDAVLEYAVDLFDEITVATLGARLVRLLARAVAAPDRALGSIDLLDASERDTILRDWNDHSDGASLATLDLQATLPELFAAQAARTPDAVALVFGGRTVSYAGLDADANRLAHHLRALGVGPETIVGLCVERTPEMLVGILGILRAGGAYLPLDPVNPQDRVAFMLADAGASVLVTQSALKDHLPQAGGATIVRLDADWPTIERHPATAPPIAIDPLHPAYVIYTSGSTGSPKGVMVAHRNVVRLFATTERYFNFNATDVWTLFHSFAFDFTVWEIWGALLYGGRLVIVPYEVSRSPLEFLSLLSRERVTILNQTPSAFYQLMQADRESGGKPLALRSVVFGGEALDLRRLTDWYARHADDAPTLVNMYGITETTVHVSYRELDEATVAANAGSLIGRGIPDLRVYILDNGLEPVPAGVTGELYVAGEGLSRGYLNRAGLTAERFVADPHGGARRAYVPHRRPGALAVRRRAGVPRPCRRAGEAPRLPDRAWRDRGGAAPAGRHLAGGGDRPRRWRRPAAGRLRGSCRRRHARSQPHCALRCRSGCRTTWSRRLWSAAALAAHAERQARPPGAAGAGAGSGRIRIGRRATRRRRSSASCSPRFCGCPRVGVDDNFFELGGHSLLATRLISRIRAVLNVEVAIRSLFEAPSVARWRRSLPAKSTALRAPLVPQPRPAEIPLSYAQRRLWFLERLEGTSGTYLIPMAVRLTGALDREALQAALGDLVERHESLRTIVPDRLGVPRQVVLVPSQARPALQIVAARRDGLAGGAAAPLPVAASICRARRRCGRICSSWAATRPGRTSRCC